MFYVFCCLINRINLCQIYDSYYKILAHEHQVNMADGQRAVLTSVWDLSFNSVTKLKFRELRAFF